MIFLVRWWHFSVTLFMAAKPSTPPKEPEIEGTKFIDRNVLQHTEVYSYWRCTQLFRIGKKNYQQFSQSSVQCPWQNGSLHWWADMLNAPKSWSCVHPIASPWLCIESSVHLIFSHTWISSVPHNPTGDQL